MKEARELQTQIEQLERHIKLQSNLIEAQTILIRRQDEKIINLAFDLEYERHTNSLKGKK
jgi:predicted transcriptional regulator